jgi:hypothetical protein
MDDDDASQIQVEAVRHTFVEERSRWEARVRQEAEQEQKRHRQGKENPASLPMMCSVLWHSLPEETRPLFGLSIL